MARMATFIIAAVLLMAHQACVYANDRLIEKITVTSDAFKEGEMIPKKYSGYGENISPGINWSRAPIGTKCMAIICEDPDALTGIWTHWVAFNIPYKAEGLPEKIPAHEALLDGTIQGMNDFKKIGYDGPHPPFGTHRYFFKVYALDTRPSVGAGATRCDLLKAMENNILAEGSLMGRYSK